MLFGFLQQPPRYIISYIIQVNQIPSVYIHALISEKSFECGRFTEIIKGQTAAFITFVLVPIANCQYGRVQRHFGVD